MSASRRVIRSGAVTAPDINSPATYAFMPVTVHKRDVFSETISGHLAEDPPRKLVPRAEPELETVMRETIAGGGT